MNDTSERVDFTTEWFVANVSRGFPSFQRQQMMQGMQIYIIVGLLTGIVGMCANAVVFVVLLLARRHFGSNVNALLTNQSAMDLLGCVFLTIGMGLSFPAAPRHYPWLGDVGNDVICFLFRNKLFPIICINSEKFGLIIITLERYFKIVHAVAHRKYYRNWMTTVGVVAPWLSGLCTFLIPAFVTVKPLPRSCLTLGFMGAWSSESGKKAFGVFNFVWHYALPIGIFVCCYGRIFYTIRRQSKVIAGHTVRVQEIAMSTSRDQNPGQVEQQATGATAGGKMSRTELNVLKTMITVILGFIICWTPASMSNLIQSLTDLRTPAQWHAAFGTFAFLNLCLNPAIYASRYEVFRKSLNKMMKTDNTVANRTASQRRHPD